MRANRRSAIPIAAFIALAFLAPRLIADDPASSMRADLARARIRAAASLVSSGDEDGARRLLAEAIDLDGTSSEALYALALLLPLGKERDSLLERAVASARWEEDDGTPARLALAQSLSRRGDYARAEEALADLGSASPGCALALAASAYFSDKAALYSSRIDEATARFPDDPAIARFWLERADPSAMTATEKRILKRVLSRLTSLSDKDGGLRALASRFMGEKARRDALRASLAAGEKGRGALVAYAVEGLMPSEAAVASFFDPLLGPPSFDELASVLAAIRDEDGKATIRARLSAYSGSIVEDARFDGFDELVADYSEGELVLVSIDRNQDGEADLVAEFADGAPSSITESSAETTVIVSYATYPEARIAAFTDDTGERRYELAAGKLTAERLKVSAPFASEKIALRKASANASSLGIAETAVMRASVRVRETRKSRDLRYDLSDTELLDGLPLRTVRTRAGTVYDRVSYASERPLRSERDADGDGRAETVVSFPASSASVVTADPWFELRVEIDENGDGVPEYREEGYPNRVKSWDYDSDGLYDSREEDLGGGRMLRSFSSRLNGVMDVEVSFLRGEPVSVTRAGKKLTIIRETGRKTFWIGSKPFDLGDSLPAKDGLHAARGRRFILFRVGESAMLEVLP